MGSIPFSYTYLYLLLLLLTTTTNYFQYQPRSTLYSLLPNYAGIRRLNNFKKLVPTFEGEIITAHFYYL